MIVGNHDDSWLTNTDRDEFLFIGPMLEVQEENVGLTVRHYPTPVYAHSGRNYMIHGHIHNETSSKNWSYFVNSSRILNADVDINHFMPVTFDETLNNNTKHKAPFKLIGTEG